MGFVSIILLNYNGKKFNQSCIDSILKQSYQDFEIIFVDNASTDTSLSEVKTLYKKEILDEKIVLVESKENTGYAGGNNLGVQNVNDKSEYICILNNDTTVDKDRLGELVKCINTDKELGAIGSVVLDKGHENNIQKTHFENHEVFALNVLGEYTKRKVSKKEVQQRRYYTSSISGCCFFYKKGIIDIPFPGFYFAYGEDVRLSLFLLAQGYKLAMCTTSIVNHLGSASFGKNPSNFKLFYGNRNQIINFLVFYKRHTKILLFPLFLITQLAHLGVNASFKRLKAKIKARKWILMNPGKISELRDKINHRRTLSDKELIKLLSYKFSDDLYRIGGGNFKNKIVKIANTIFTTYLRIFFQ